MLYLLIKCSKWQPIWSSSYNNQSSWFLVHSLFKYEAFRPIHHRWLPGGKMYVKSKKEKWIKRQYITFFSLLVVKWHEQPLNNNNNNKKNVKPTFFLIKKNVRTGGKTKRNQRQKQCCTVSRKYNSSKKHGPLLSYNIASIFRFWWLIIYQYIYSVVCFNLCTKDNRLVGLVFKEEPPK